MATPEENPLGTFLKGRRTQLDPAAFGFTGGRRRTPVCGARKSRSAPTSARPGTHGWSREGAAHPRRMCSTASPPD